MEVDNSKDGETTLPAQESAGQSLPPASPASPVEADEGDGEEDEREMKPCSGGAVEVELSTGEDSNLKIEKKKLKKSKEERKHKATEMCRLPHEDLDWIWIGDAEDARDRDRLRRNGIKYILNCTHPRKEGGVSNFFKPDFDYCRLVIGDNGGERLSLRFQAAWDFFEKARIREDGGILVHCQQGVSRSVSMVCSYLMKFYRFSFVDALKLAKTARTQAGPNGGFTEQLKQFEAELIRTNGFEKVPPKRKCTTEDVGIAGPLKRSAVGATRGPARGPLGPSIGPSAATSIGPSVGPQRRPVVGPQVGPACGPTVGPSVGPVVPSSEKKKREKVGPARPPSQGPAGPVIAGPAKPKTSKAVDLT
eukprot:TRINITY_DN6148_c0_g1_i1.p1 TRINITY_DN6148_c0_g1~~TRINITY_DN6148_c0_g1_i1.p1  ORF type:complete len:363 (-),score=66.09 TRINITY_DN6148_c0_g1_i1:276-1364(-)